MVSEILFLGISVIPRQDLYLYQFPLDIFLDSLDDAFCGTGVLIYPLVHFMFLDATAFICTLKQ